MMCPEFTPQNVVAGTRLCENDSAESCGFLVGFRGKGAGTMTAATGMTPEAVHEAFRRGDVARAFWT